MTGAAMKAVPMPAAAPVAAPKGIRQRRTRWGAFAVAVMLMALGGLLSGFAYLATTTTRACVAVVRSVHVGSQVSSADLTTVQINVPPGLAPVRAGQLRQVIGKRAAVELVPGSLLTMAQLTDRELVGEGQRQIGVGLKPERLPARTLHPGDQVQLVATPADNSVVSSNVTPAGAAEKFDATVVDTAARGAAGSGTDSWVVYLAVSEQDAPEIVTLAAQGRLTMVLKAGG